MPVKKAQPDSPQSRSFWLHPLLGYLFSLLLVALSIVILKMKLAFLHTIFFPGATFLLAVVLVAFLWGLAPAIFTLCLSVLALDYFYVLPVHQFNLTTWEDIVQMLPFVTFGLLVAVIIVQRGTVLRRARAAEYEQHKRANQLEGILEAIADAVVVYDKDGLIVETNSIGEHMVQLAVHSDLHKKGLQERAEHVQLSDEVGHPLLEEQMPQLRILRGETLSGANAVDIKVRLEDGSDFYASISGSPLRDQDGNLIGAVCIYRDVTERRQLELQAQKLAQEALARASELEATFEAITDSVLIYDEQGMIRRSNSATHSRFPIFNTQPLAERAAHLVICNEQGVPLPVEQLPVSRVLRGESLAGTEAADIIVRTAVRQAEQGEQGVQVSVTGAPIRDADGRLTGAVVVLRDVTKRRQLERRTQQTLSALLSMAETLVYNNVAPQYASPQDGETYLQSATPSAYSVIYHLAELVHRALGSLRVSVSLPDAAGVPQPAIYIGFSAEQEQQLHRTALDFRANDAYTQVLTNLRKGNVQIIDSRQPPFTPFLACGVSMRLIVPLFLDKQLVGVLSFDSDEADHVYTADEIALAKATTRLIALVIERERLERERTEARANELSLREANRRMDEFLGIVSHELRTPLTAMKGYIQVADLKLTKILAAPPRQCDALVSSFEALHQLFQRADIQAELLNRLVNDLVDVSRIHAGKLRMNLARCDLTTVVSNAVYGQQQIASTRSISLHLPTNMGAVSVFADADRIGQVVTNYLTNALKYSKPERAVAVFLSIEGGVARVEVRDEGPGLSHEQVEHIWERFYQVQGITVQSGSSVGLGIGLHICHTIISSHGGQVGIESSPGQGSTFWFTLPLREEAGT